MTNFYKLDNGETLFKIYYLFYFFIITLLLFIIS